VSQRGLKLRAAHQTLQLLPADVCPPLLATNGCLRVVPTGSLEAAQSWQTKSVGAAGCNSLCGSSRLRAAVQFSRYRCAATGDFKKSGG
jgi:hypothetical protein